MTERFDAVVIGAGIIGTSIAFSMSKAGWRVLVVDPLAGSGQGATSSSVAMVRTQYSTLEGSALAWEGFHCWQDWSGFLNLESDEPVAPFHLAGVLTFKTANNGFLEHQLEFSRQLGIPFEFWSVSRLQSLSPAGISPVSDRPLSRTMPILVPAPMQSLRPSFSLRGVIAPIHNLPPTTCSAQPSNTAPIFVSVRR